MKIRQANTKDLHQVIKLSLQMWNMHQDEAKDFVDLSYITPKVAREYFLDFLKSKNKAIFVAEDKGKIIASANVTIIKLQKFFTSKKCAYLDDLMVDENYRGKKVATKLNDEMEKFASEKGIKMLKARAYSFNKPAQRLLKKRGFTNLYSEYFKKID
jgi:ribosomal protein S18 acetylase RimI-like enzyme